MNSTIEYELRRLDLSLEYFRTVFEQGGISFNQFVNHFDPEDKIAFGHVAMFILEKLERDELIFKETINEIHYYHISLEGRIFEGDVQQKMDDESTRLQKHQRNERIERNEVLVWIAGFLLALVEALTHWHDLMQFFCGCH